MTLRSALIFAWALSVSVVSTASAQTPRILWGAQVKKQFPARICEPSGILSSCLAFPEGDCIGVFTDAFEECYTKSNDQLPWFFTAQTGGTWGRKLGECSADVVLQKLPPPAEPTDSCLRALDDSDFRAFAAAPPYDLALLAAKRDPRLKTAVLRIYYNHYFGRHAAVQPMRVALSKQLRKNYVRLAPRPELLRFARANLEYFRTAEAENAEACRMLERSRKAATPEEQSKALLEDKAGLEDNQRRLTKVKEAEHEAIKAAIADPQALPSADMLALMEKRLEEEIERRAKSRPEVRQVFQDGAGSIPICRAMTLIYETVLALPENVQEAALREVAAF